MTATYQSQLDSIFNHPVTDPAWYWSEHPETDIWEEDPLAAFTFIETLLLDPATDLSPYTDDQIGLGLNYIFNNSCSNLSIYFKEADLPFDRKVTALRSLIHLFQDVFNPRCTHGTAANSRERSSLLHTICYMFWDVCPLSNWIEFTNMDEISASFMSSLPDDYYDTLGLPPEALEIMKKLMPQSTTAAKTPEEIMADMQQQYKQMDADTRGYYEAIAGVMQQCLDLDNPACVESALHGLGEMMLNLPDIAGPILDNFMENGKNHDKALLEYAAAARQGAIL